MGLNFRKSFKIAPGVRVNVSKRGVGASFGGKGLRYSINSRGQRRATAGIPGSGIYYTTTSSGRNYRSNAYKQHNELKKQQREAQKRQEIEYNQYQVELFENKLEMIKSIHKECDTHVDWEEVRQAPPPFLPGQTGPNETIARKAANNYKPGFFEKLFKQDMKKRVALQSAIETGKKKDQDEYDEWEHLVQIASKVLEGDPDTYFQVLEEFAPLDDLAEFGSGFEFFMEDPSYLEVEFDVHSSSVVPNEILSLTKTGKLSKRAMPKTKKLDIEQDYVCSCVLRIAGDLFALLPIDYVYIHANDERLNTVTGHTEKETIVSAKIDKETFKSLNFEAIDCSDSLNNFEHNMKFLKTKGFQPVEKLVKS
ncbi:DUF4236 domain-containing protein [Bacillus sp. 1P02SD]|uniref:DUF4236 domain-containing protein n=1 Tax=Bacillus sp. 1P02SD TaxID=3132264 RepID=UPI0039A13E57